MHCNKFFYTIVEEGNRNADYNVYFQQCSNLLKLFYIYLFF